MPFDVFVSRELGFKSVRDKPASRPITTRERNGAFKGAPGDLCADGTWRIRRPDTGEPWFAARDDRGHLVLSCSYANHRFLANFADMLEQALRIGEVLGARVFEEVRESLVTRAKLGALLDPDGEYVKLQVGTFQGARQRMDSDPGAPLEWPLGPIDIVSEYFVVHVLPTKPVPSTIEELCADLDVRASIRPQTEVAALVLEATESRELALAKVLLRPDRKIQVWPAHGYVPFAKAAQTVLAVARALGAKLGGSLTFNGRPLTGTLAQTVEARAQGLGLEMYEWVNREFA